MALTNAEHQRNYRQRRNALAKRALELEAAAAAPPINPLPEGYQARAGRVIAAELVALKAERRRLKSRRDAAGLAEIEATIAVWEAVRARLCCA